MYINSAGLLLNECATPNLTLRSFASPFHNSINQRISNIFMLMITVGYNILAIVNSCTIMLLM